MFEALDVLCPKMDKDKLAPPRLSILKQNRRSFEDLEEIVSRPSTSRRVSFAASNYVKPFAADAEQNTIWDSTYEEIVNHIDSTGSSQASKQQTNDDFNTTTIVDEECAERVPKSGFVLNIWTDSDSESSQIDEVMSKRPKKPVVPIDADLDKENKKVAVPSVKPVNVEVFTDNYDEFTMDFTQVISKPITESQFCGTETRKSIVNQTVLDVVEMEETQIIENDSNKENGEKSLMDPDGMDQTKMVEGQIIENCDLIGETGNKTTFNEVGMDQTDVFGTEIIENDLNAKNVNESLFDLQGMDRSEVVAAQMTENNDSKVRNGNENDEIALTIDTQLIGNQVNNENVNEIFCRVKGTDQTEVNTRVNGAQVVEKINVYNSNCNTTSLNSQIINNTEIIITQNLENKLNNREVNLYSSNVKEIGQTEVVIELNDENVKDTFPMTQEMEVDENDFNSQNIMKPSPRQFNAENIEIMHNSTLEMNKSNNATFPLLQSARNLSIYTEDEMDLTKDLLKDVDLTRDLLKDAEKATTHQPITSPLDSKANLTAETDNVKEESRMDVDVSIPLENPNGMGRFNVSGITLLSDAEYLIVGETKSACLEKSFERFQKMGANMTEDMFLTHTQQAFDERTVNLLNEDGSVVSCRPIQDTTSFHMNLSTDDVQLVDNSSDSFRFSETATDSPLDQTNLIPQLIIPSFEEFEYGKCTHSWPPIPKEFDLSYLNEKAVRDHTKLYAIITALCEEHAIKKDQLLRENMKILNTKIGRLDEEFVGLQRFLDELDDDLEAVLNRRSSIGDNSQSLDAEMVSVHKKIQEASKRSESCYMYERHDNNIYYFTALDKVIQFVVILSPESEIIKSINVIIDRKDYSRSPVNYFLLRILEEKLSCNNLRHFLGEKYDIISLLDYWKIAVDECMDFYDEFRQIQLFDYVGHCLNIDENFSVHFELVSRSSCKHWSIDVKLCPKNYAIESEDNIVIYDVNNKSTLSNGFVSKYLNEFPRDVHFLRNFIVNVVKYFKETKKSNASLATDIDYGLLCDEYLSLVK